MDSTMESATTETKPYKEGQLIKGKDFIRLESPLVLPSQNTPLLTEAQDFVGAINELFTSGTGANGAFRAVFDDNAGTLAIVVQEGNKYTDYQFGYEVFDFFDEITTQTVVGGEKVKTTRNFSKRIVTLLLDASGAVLLVTDYNADNGVILGYTDGSGEVVHTAEWRTEYESVVSQSPGAASAAVAWVIARNMEQTTSLSEEKQAYKDGLKVGVDGGANITEEYEQDSNSIELTTDENGGISEPFIGSLTDGIYCTTPDGGYVYMYLDMSYSDTTTYKNSWYGSGTQTDTGKMIFDTYDANGTLIEHLERLHSYAYGWTWNNTVDAASWQALSLSIDNGYVSSQAVRTSADGAKEYVTVYWLNGYEEAYKMLCKTTQVSNISPEII